jgi:hypothetical protein
MQDHLALIGRREALDLGMTAEQIRGRLDNGTWRRVHPNVYAAAGAPCTPEQDLLAACMAAGPSAAASHASSAWMLGLIADAPPRPVLTVPARVSLRLRGVIVHRSRDLNPARILERRGIPYTDALRVLTDLAAELGPDRLTPIVDRAIATRLVSAEGLVDEVGRRRSRGRKGPAQLIAHLDGRGITGGPAPSVLEAEAMRLFRRWGIPVIGREVRAGSDGRYRIDFLIAPGLAVEVDGFAYHWSPEAKAYDDARRNRLRASGTTVLVYDWRAIHFEPRRVATEIQAALVRRAS